MDVPMILFSVAFVWTIAAISPGPNFILSVQTAMGQSRRSALFVGFGFATGTAIWGLSGYFGLAMLFKTAAWLYVTLKFLGGGYLVFLGIKLIRSNATKNIDPRPRISTGSNLFQSYKSGLLTNLSNPKTAAFITSLFAATLPPDTPVWLGFLSVAVMVLIALTWYSIVAFVFSMHRFQKRYQKARAWFERFAGAILIGFGGKFVLGD